MNELNACSSHHVISAHWLYAADMAEVFAADARDFERRTGVDCQIRNLDEQICNDT